MKTSLVCWLLGGLILSSPAWMCSSASAETRQITAQVQGVTGAASYKLPGQPEVKIQPGTTIPAGATIQTAPGASVDVFLGRNTGVLRLAESTSLTIKTLQVTETGSETVTDTQLVLQKGEFFGHVNKQSPASTYQVTLPDGVVDLKQTRFQIVNRGTESVSDTAGNGSAGNALQSTVRVIMGQASFTHDGSSQQFNGPGEINPSSGVIIPLSSDSAQAIVQVFNTMDLKAPAATEVASTEDNPGKNKKSTTQNPTRVLEVSARTVQPQVQDLPLSPTIGGQ